MATQPRGRGFWRGFVTGLLVAVVAAVALAIAFPPTPLLPPDVPDGSLQAPPAPDRPQAATEPEPGGLLPAPAPAPLVPGLPAPGTPPADAPASPGSPSLAQPAAN